MKESLLKLLSTAFALLISLSVSAQQNGNLRGKITTADGKPAEFVTVTLKENKVSALTNDEGEYQLRVKAGTYTAKVLAVGLSSQEKSVTIVAGQTITLDFVLNENSKQLEEVVVSGNSINKFNKNESDFVAKMPLKRMENSQVYSTISKQLMVEQLSFSVDDAVKNVPGLTKMWEATGRSGDGGSFYTSRGFVTQSQLRNGVAGNVSSRVDAANLDRIEVIKGPSATLFGSTLTSYGGLINRVTKKPYERFGGEVSLSAGSFGFSRVSADVNAPLTHDNNVLFRLNTAYSYEGSFQDNGFNKGFILAPSLTYKVNDKLSFSLDAEFFNGQNTGYQAYFLLWNTNVADLGAASADKLNLDYKRSYITNSLYQTSRNSNFFGQMDYKISNQWNSQTNFTFTNSFSDGFSPYFYLIPDNVISGNPSAVGLNYISRNDQSTADSKDQVMEIQQNFMGDFKIGGLKNRFVGGLDVFMRNSNQYFFGSNLDTIAIHGEIPNYNNFNDIKMDSVYASRAPDFTYPDIYKNTIYSGYVSDVLNVTDNLIVSAALRIDYFENKGRFNAQMGEATGAYNQWAFSPKFGVVFQPLKDKISIFANYQNGFKNQTGANFNQETFKPEQANQLEGGIKLDAFGGKLSSTISYYNIKVKDVVRTDLAHPGFSIQDGTQVSRGIEAEVIANPINGFNIIAGFGYNDSKMEKADEDVQGLRPYTAGSPYTANLWVSYKLTEGKAKGLGIGFGGNYASDNKIINSVSQGTFILPAFTVLNATAFYDRPKFRFGVKLDNLTNEKYWIGYSTINPQKTRNFSASLALKFY